jgi:hypothetical protein
MLIIIIKTTVWRVAKVKFLHPSEPQFPHLQKRVAVQMALLLLGKVASPGEMGGVVAMVQIKHLAKGTLVTHAR